MAIYTPYFYIIQDVRNGMYYAGAKWAPDANPDNFMVEGGYTTSSKTINELINRHGLNNFVVRKIRSFETADEAQYYETRFLRKLDAKRHPRFYNGHNNDGAMDHSKTKIIMLELYGVENAFQSKQIQEKIRKVNLERHGVEHPSHSEVLLAKKEENNLKKYGVRNVFQDENVKQTIRETNLLKYGSENAMGSDIIQEKRKTVFQEKYGVDHYSQTEEYMAKLRKTNLERYGVDHYSQTEESKEKVRKTSLERYGVEHPAKCVKVKETARKTNKERYGCDYYTQTEEYKLSRKETGKKLTSRPVVKKIKEINSRINASLTNGWYQKHTEVLEEILEGLESIERMLRVGVTKKEIAEMAFNFHFRFK